MHSCQFRRLCRSVLLFCATSSMQALPIFATFLILIQIHLYNAENYTPVVTTVNGDVRGLRKNYGGKIVDEFKGIPFGRPPVGDRRWTKTETPEDWQGVMDATNFSSPCIQTHSKIPHAEEDCLYLNIYLPYGLEYTRNSTLPVMVWTHGGGFQTGSPRVHDARDLTTTGDVIVVTHNYRVSVLGGLSTADDNARGNYMLWDARAALVWVNNNIANFGGDTKKITIFGQSAGGSIVSHLVASPTTEGLFQRAIALSGVASGPIGLQYKYLENTKNVAFLQDCPQDDTSDLIKCLRTKNARDVDEAGYPAMTILSGRLPGWAPVVDGDIVAERSEDAFRKGAGKNIDYMIGKAHDDAAGFVYNNMFGIKGDQGNIAADKASLELALRFILSSYVYKDEDVDMLLGLLLKQYPDINNDDLLTRTKAVSRAMTDVMWLAPMHREATYHKQSVKAGGTKKKTFTYDFRYRSTFVSYAPWVTGSHNDDIYMLFGEPYLKNIAEKSMCNFSQPDYIVSEHMMKYFANFAHSGDPSVGPHTIPAVWKEYNPDTRNFMELSDNMHMKKEDQQTLGHLDFWLNTFPNITTPGDTVTSFKFSGDESEKKGLEALLALVRTIFES